jgi:quercetin dioxygenase-like cupin family protein
MHSVADPDSRIAPAWHAADCAVTALALAAGLLNPGGASAQALAGADGERSGITAIARHTFEDATMPGKEFRILRTTYAPGGQNPKHYHASHVVFYVLEGTGVWQEEGKAAVTLKPGDSLHVRPGTIHAHRNASATDPLVFLEFVIVDKGQRSTVPMR